MYCQGKIIVASVHIYVWWTLIHANITITVKLDHTMLVYCIGKIVVASVRYICLVDTTVIHANITITVKLEHTKIQQVYCIGKIVDHLL